MANILVVDDDVHVMKAEAQLLTLAGHQVLKARTGQEGLEVLKREPMPDCIVLDVEMPVMSGPEMAYAMLLHDAGQELIPILLVSGRSDLATVAARIGTRYFLSKGDVDYSGRLIGLVATILKERDVIEPE
jgi:CheY-like chemotaxis protein